MRTIKIVADSSANLLHLQQVPFAIAPLKIITTEREFIDDSYLNVSELVSYFHTYKGKSKTSCPNTEDWLTAFGDADDIFCVTITSGLSGCFNSACIAKKTYEEANPGKRVHVIDSLSAGPELTLLIEQLERWILEGFSYDEILPRIQPYLEGTGLLFMLGSLKNFAANGRVSPAIAKITGLFGIRIVGKASDKGTLEPLHKCRGEQKSLDAIVKHIKKDGFQNGKIRIAHCCNDAAANQLKLMILSEFPEADIQIRHCLGLCSYYAENGGLLVGYEKK